MSNDKFKNSPIHDKQAIISMMDELEPKDMIEVVELLKSKQQKPHKQQTVVDRIVNLLNKEGFAPVLTQEEIKSFKEMEKEQKRKDFVDGYTHGDSPLNHSVIDKWYEKTYGGGEQ